MNIVYAVKIFAALAIVLGLMRLVAANGLRVVTTPTDWRAGWTAILGTLAISCFSWKVPLFFMVFSAWALYVPRLFGKDGQGRLPAYALLACVSPQFSMELENIGPIQDLLRLDIYRVLAIFILLPEAVRLISRREREPRPSWLVVTDFAMFGYFAYWTLYLFGHRNATTLVREGAGIFLDYVLPYYVVSRACIAHELRQRVMSMMLFGAVYEAMVGLVEGVSRHFLYAQLQYLYGERWSMLEGLTRGWLVRAQAGFGGPLVLAVLLLFGFGIWLALKPAAKSRPYALVGFILLAGLAATLSRGPILAFLVMAGFLAATRFIAAPRLLLASGALAVVVAATWSMGLGEFVVGLINSVSGGDKTADFNVAYREELLRTSIALIKQSPWFGVPNYIQEMESLRQGEGIIDLVNTYLVVTLNVGLVGLAMFVLPFLVTLWKLATGIPDDSAVLRRETIVWIALTLGVMVTVFTVSPVSIIRSILMWVIAFAVAMLRERAPARARLQPAVTLANAA